MTEENRTNLLRKRVFEKDPGQMAAQEIALVRQELLDTKVSPREAVLHITEVLLDYFNPLWSEEYGFEEES